MSTNKKKFGLYSTGPVVYNLDGATFKGRQPRPYKQPLFNIWTIITILASAVGIVYLLYQVGIV